MEHGFLLDYFASLREHREECAYVHPRGYRWERWSYGRLVGCAFQFARELEQRGIGRGERVLLWGRNSAEWVAAFWGCVLRGVVVVPMDDVATPEFALRVAQQAEVKLAAISRAHATTFAETARLILDDLEAALQQHPSAPDAPPALTPNEVLEIVFTSGATAEPKGVVITHGNVLANLEPIEQEMQRYLKYERWVHPIRFLNLLPLSHVFGQFLGIFLPPLLGGTVIFQESLNPSAIMETIRRERVSVLVAVPRVLQSLKEKLERDLEAEGRLPAFIRRFGRGEGKHFLERWWVFRRERRRFGWKFWAFICGGAALDRETEEFWTRLGYAVIQGYGLTETTSLISLNHPFRLGRGSIGKVLPGRDVRLAEDGEILVRGGGIASAYWKDGALEPVADARGWYRTGDVGELDEAGNLYFKGRKKEVIVTSAGMNIYPQDLEAALRRQPEVRDCVVVAVERGGGPEPCAVLLLSDPQDSAEAVVNKANASLAEYQKIRAWHVWMEPDFPRTGTQKPRVGEIREVVQAQFGGQAGVVAAGSPLSQLIARIAHRPEQPLSPAARLDADLNLSSLERVELLGALEERCQVDLSEARFASVNTVGDIEQMLRAAPARAAGYHYPHWTLGWPFPWLRALAFRLLIRPAVFLLARPRIEGQENLQNFAGPGLVICNHISDVDIGFVLYALPAALRRRLAVAVGGEALEALRTPPETRPFFLRLYKRIQWALGVALLNLFPLPREAGFRRSFAYAGEAVDRGYSVLVFPEGQHTLDGKLRPFRVGVGLLAEDLRLPVVPLRIDGLYEVKTAGRKTAPPDKIVIRIGAPITFSPATEAAQIAGDLEIAVRNL
jgi:long-chain acyl-CoA synthetase